MIGDNVEIRANSIIEGAHIADHCSVGPFARLRPGTELATGARIGNFVETKNAVIGEDSKANHLAYVGDASVGQRVNIGAGVITCNYDGANKHQTKIENDAFIGSNTALVAPLTVGEGATVGGRFGRQSGCARRPARGDPCAANGQGWMGAPSEK